MNLTSPKELYQILYQTATNFLQGLYPPLGELNSTLATEEPTNGTSSETPLNGYQFILIHGEGETDPDTIWIKGDDACPTYDKASKSYRDSQEYQTTLSQSASFYSKFTPLLARILGNENVSYSHAYDVFDLLNVASIHNTSVASEINSEDLHQLRYLANQWEWNHNYNASQPDRSIGGMTLAGGFLRQLKSVVDSQAKTKFSLMTGSYDTFLSFFGITNLAASSPDFEGIPNYAANMAFELYTDGTEPEFPTNPEQDLMVRFLFRNGTNDNASLDAYPLFGGSEDSLPYGRFVEELSSRSILTLSDWCTTCQSDAEFCTAATRGISGSASPYAGTNRSGLSNGAAGAIGAVVALAVAAIVGGAVWFILRRRSRKPALAQYPPLEKVASDSGSNSV
jgi:Histidine phosphatase superfamily (branch 2)